MRSASPLLYSTFRDWSSLLLSPRIHTDNTDFRALETDLQSVFVRVIRGEEVAYCPVPVSFITSGLSGALSLTVTAPLIEPFTLGVNVTLNVQVAPEATVAPQGVPPDGVAE